MVDRPIVPYSKYWKMLTTSSLVTGLENNQNNNNGNSNSNIFAFNNNNNNNRNNNNEDLIDYSLEIYDENSEFESRWNLIMYNHLIF